MKKSILTILAVLFAVVTGYAQQSIPWTVQSNYAIPASGTTVSVLFNAGQAAGDLNLVVVGWNDTTHTVSSVTDTTGNVYKLAVGPTVGTNLTQSIYYANSIAPAAAAANTVTVTFSGSASFPDVRILEYGGTGDPIDVTSAGFGTSTSASSGSAATTHLNELVVGAGTTSGGFSGPGTGFTQDILNSNGDIVEHAGFPNLGTYSATAPLSASNNWVFQMVTLKSPYLAILCQSVPSSDTITATTTETAFATSCVVPPNAITTNSILRLTAGFKFVDGATAATSFRVRGKIGSTYFYDSSAQNAALNQTRNTIFKIDLTGTAAPGASTSLGVAGVGSIMSINTANVIAGPISGIATNAAQTITFTMVNGAAGNGNSSQLLDLTAILIQ